MLGRGKKFSLIERCAGLYQGVRDRDSSEIVQLLRGHFFDHTIHGNTMNLIALIVGEQVEGSGNPAQGAGAGDLMTMDLIALLQLPGGNAQDPVAWGELKLGPIGESDGEVPSASGVLLVLMDLLYGHGRALVANDKVAGL